MSPITLISTLPAFITPEQHSALLQSTPASFSDISPVLRHKEEGVKIVFDPPVRGLEGLDEGVVYICESVLAFMSTTNPGHGFQIEYPSITLHAISRAESGPSIYCQLDEGPSEGGPDAGGAPNGGEEGEEEVAEIRELKIIPRTEASLELMFEAISTCASLHPDKPTESDEDDDGGMFGDTEGGGFEVFTGDADQEMSEVGRAALEYLESIIVYPASVQGQAQVEVGAGAIGNGNGTKESPVGSDDEKAQEKNKDDGDK